MQPLSRYFVLSLLTLFVMKPGIAQILAISVQQQSQLGIVTQSLVSNQQSSYLNLPARVVVPPDQTYIVSAAQNGIISNVLIGEGDTVLKGQTLLTMFSPDLLRLQHGYLSAQNQLQLDRNQHNRLRSLWDDGVISERRWLELNSAVKIAQTRVNQQHSLLQLAGMTKNQIYRLRVENKLTESLTVNAPANGVILKRFAVPGQRLEMMTQLFHLADLSSLWLEIAVPARQIDQVKIGDQVAIDHHALSATVIYIGRNVDTDNQTVLVRALIKNPPADIRVDQLLNTSFKRSHQPIGFLLPVSAVIRQSGQTYVFVEVEGGFEVRHVTITTSNRQFVVVSTGLSAKDKIAVKGLAALKAAWQSSGDSD